jgi:hypothetical protein
MSFSTIKIQDEEVEVTTEIVQIYKNTTGKRRVTKKGIEKFFNSLFEKINLHLIF